MTEAKSGRLVARVGARDPAAEAVPDHPPADIGDVLGGKAEVFEDGRPGCRGAEMVDPDHRPIDPGVAIPAEGYARLDGDPFGGCPGQDGVAIGLILALERGEAGQAHQPGPDPVGLERVPGQGRHPELGARCDEDQVDPARPAARFAQDVAALADAVAGRRRGLGQGGQLLPGEAEGDRTVAPLD